MDKVILLLIGGAAIGYLAWKAYLSLSGKGGCSSCSSCSSCHSCSLSHSDMKKR